MKEIKRELMWFEFYEDAAIAEHLTAMAEKGWLLEQAGNLWRYRRAEPRKIRYTVTYFSESSEFNPIPTENEETLREYCAAAGWDYVTSWHQMVIFSTDRADAPPIETDERTKLAAVHRAMKKNFLPGNLVLLALFGFNLLIQLSVNMDDFVQYLSDGMQLGTSLLVLMLLVYYGGNLISYGLWYRRSRRSVERGGPCVERKNRFKRGKQVALLAFSAAVMALLYIPSALAYGHETAGAWLIYSGIYGLEIAAVWGLRKWMKRRGVNAWTNRLVSVGGGIVLALALTAGTTALMLRADLFQRKGAEEYVNTHGNTWTIYHDDLPLTMEDLRGADEKHWSYEIRVKTSPLAVYRDAQQTEYDDWERLNYEILDVRAGFLRQSLLNDWLDLSDWNNEMDPDEGYVYRSVDAQPWGADAVYQLERAGEPTGTFILCKGKRIVRIYLEWEPAAKQMALTGEKLLTDV